MNSTHIVPKTKSRKKFKMSESRREVLRILGLSKWIR